MLLPTLQLTTMLLPKRALALINAFIKPVTRPDWHSNPKFTFKQFFQGIKKQNKYLLIYLYYKVVNGMCYIFIINKYKEYINCGYSKQDVLQEIQNKYGLEPHITCLMCDI